MSIAKILWVDDEIDSLTSQIMFLENKGYEVQTKTNGFDAVEYVKDNIVDVVLLDETMPGITGLQVLQQIKADEKLRMIPVVVLTSSHEERDMVASYKLGVNAYVVKPVDFHEFINAVKELGIFWAVINEPPPGSIRKR